ncbi:DUF4172 domain-containing protein [Gillisia limnaea]|uniref:DUF4172 domain-containing protein n=1 Tax=Gillisia limnaea TaxID=195907 RepID=UPI0002FDD381|nr:DUF4172 domain-containing protein [Gillisia limnaea]
MNFQKKQEKINGILESLPKVIKTETFIELLISEAIKTSEIEGEYLSRKGCLAN